MPEVGNLRRAIFAAVLSLGVIASPASANELESRYFYWGIGWASFSYPAEIQRVVDDVKGLGLDNISLTLDLLGFYWPRGDQMLLGFVLNASGDRFEEGSDYFQINSYLPSLSGMFFFNNKIGKGPFCRVDVGPTRLNLNSSLQSTVNSEWGVGVLLGGGVAFPVSSGSRLLANVNYTVRKTEGDSIKILGVSVGGLF